MEHSMKLKTLVVTSAALAALLALTAFAGCGGGSGSSVGSGGWVQTELYLGLDIPGDGVVGEAEFQRFLDEVVSVEFPLGMTVYDAYGQMKNDDGSVVRQSTKVVLLVHRDDDASSISVARVIEAYRERFGGPQVMHSTSRIDVEFFSSDTEEAAVRQEVVDFVEEAASYAEANGKEAALAEFSDPDGSFKRGELYIYAYDFSGNVIAHGGNQALIGQNLIDYTDPNGVKVIQGLIEVAEGGSGWFAYTWDNPQTGKQEPKQGYVVKVDDTWWLGSGTYTR